MRPRVRFLPGALLCYVMSYAVLIAMAMRKDVDWDAFSLVVWLLSALAIFAVCAIVPLVVRVAVKFRTTVFLLLWAGTIAVLGTALVLNAK